MKIPAIYKYIGFYDLLCDGVYQYRLANECNDPYLMNRHARASILAAVLTLECCANCLIDSLNISNSLINDLDKLTVVAKFETYLRFKGIEMFDRGRNEVQKIVELIRARNDFVHPKTSNIKTEVGRFKEQGEFIAVPIELHEKSWEAIGIPKRALFWSADNALSVLKAVTGFFSYLFQDLIKSDVKEIHYLLSPHLEINDAIVPNIFQDFENELSNAIKYGLDYSFLGIGNA